MANRENRITHLDNEYTAEKRNQNKVAQQSRKARLRRIKLIIFFGVVVLFAVSVPLIRNTIQARQMNQQATEATEELESLNEHQEKLNYYIGLLNDEEYVSKLARSEYYVSGEDEIVFSIPEDGTPDHQEVIEGNPQTNENEESQ